MTNQTTPRGQAEDGRRADVIKVIRLARVRDQSNSQIIREGRASINRAVKSSAKFAFWLYTARNIRHWSKGAYVVNALAAFCVAATDLYRVGETLEGIRAKRMFQADSFSPAYARALEVLQKLEVSRIRNGLVYANSHQMVLDALLRGEQIGRDAIEISTPSRDDSFWKWQDAKAQTYNLISSDKPASLLLLDLVTGIKDAITMGRSPMEMAKAIIHPDMQRLADLYGPELSQLVREATADYNLNVGFKMTLDPAFKAATVDFAGKDPTIAVSVTLPLFLNRLLGLYFGQLSPNSILHYVGLYAPVDVDGDIRSKIAAEIENYFLTCKQGELQQTDIQSLLRLKPAAQAYKGVVFSLVVNFVLLHEVGHILTDRGLLQSDRDSQLSLESSIDAWAVERLANIIRTKEYDRAFVALRERANKESKSSIFGQVLSASNPYETASAMAMLAVSLQEHAGMGHVPQSASMRRQYLAALSSHDSDSSATGALDSGLVKFFASAEWRSLLED